MSKTYVNWFEVAERANDESMIKIVYKAKLSVNVGRRSPRLNLENCVKDTGVTSRIKDEEVKDNGRVEAGI